MIDLTWTCMVCREERPDEAISVFKTQLFLRNGVVADFNVRYCNDRQECIDGAPLFAELYQDVMNEKKTEGKGT